MKKVLTMLIVSVFLLSLTIGCTAKEEPAAEATPEAGTTESASEKTEEPVVEDVVLKIMDWNDSIYDQRMLFHEEYQEKNPNVTIEYTMLTIDQYYNTLMAAVTAGDLPDLFLLPDSIELSTAIEENWVQSFDDYLSDGFSDIFLDGQLVEGINMVDGKFYSVSNQLAMAHSNIFYNKDLFVKAGLDPEQPPKTYSELREYAKKITEAGNGEFYGIIEGGTQVNRWNVAAKGFAALGGLAIDSQTPVNLKTGTADYTHQAMLETFELFKGMAEDGSYHPSTMSIKAPEARAMFANGEAGFLIQGVWCIGVWHKDNPDLNLGVAPQVYPDGTGLVSGTPHNSAGTWLCLSATTEFPQIATDYFEAYFSDDEYSMQKDTLEAGAQFSPVKGLNEKYITDKDLLAYYDAAQTYQTAFPLPKVINPDVITVLSKYQDVSPSVGDLLQGTVAGAIDDYESALAELSTKTDEALAKAIKEAADEGSKATIDDFIYEWDAMENYSE